MAFMMVISSAPRDQLLHHRRPSPLKRKLCPPEVAMRELTPLAADVGSEMAAKATLDRVLSLVERSSAHEPAFSNILLTELMKSKTVPQVATFRSADQATAEKRLQSDMVSDLETSPISLPAKESAQNLVKAYFQFANLSLPSLHEPTFQQKLELLYNMPRMVDLAEVHTKTESRLAVFFVLEVFAVALLTLQKQDPSRVPTSLADRYHKTALRALSEVGLPNGVEGVQALLLVGQYSYHHPTVWAVWKTVGAALRLAVELGLHQDPPPGELDFLTLDTMRRTFWVAYAMDRNISISLAMPSCLSDGAITAKFPSQVNDEFITSEGIVATDADCLGSKSVGLHVFRYRQIQSEMRTVLGSKTCTRAFKIGIAALHAVTGGPFMNEEIWRTLNSQFHRALFYLYHPSLNIPSPSESALVALTEAATRMIQLYRRFFDERRLTIYWQAVENLSSAGTALMNSYFNSLRVQERITFRSLESLVHTCSSVLWGMVEHFPAFKGKRDAFGIVASKILADLDNGSAAPREAGKLSIEDNVSTGERSHRSRDTEYAPSPVQQEGQQLVSGAKRADQSSFTAMSAVFDDQTQSQQPQLPPPTTGSEISTYLLTGRLLKTRMDF
ncbi:uncharacterized protein Z518_00486 [Rhinocladiella mackenziei CBS 650.93]|uniref:Xylanolytic transcriptional activator regulatory domain-containing protein n=1 Tax=Rhinocladiella mackenziei CBS 650.93 TaxID=1442369 RepID=A0A0D2J139_9EURO|nr:uncharacterized protein Z518_00486 [Rhinocladiella mackenziei CBS 650.93]KIX09406.1 hypothetical protein Z518_00486 [Rhinocladiella mackenziei CBS 650.93]